MTADSQSQARARSRHDLLTYVNHMVGFSELILGTDEALAEDDRARLQAVLTDTKKLAALIDALFDPSMSEEKRRLLDLFSIRQQILQPLSRIIGGVEALMERWRAGGMAGTNIDDLQNVLTAGRQLREVITGIDITVPTAQATQAVEEGPAEEPLILVVDDNAMNRDVLSRQLKRIGYRTECAEHGRQALQMVRDLPVDLVLLDIMMPEIDGIEVLRQIKANPSLSHIPVIMISALDQVETIVSCIQAGAADYLSKPFEPVVLKARVGACVQTKKLLDKEKRYREQIEDYNLHLETRVRQQVREITIAQLATIFALSKLAESRDPETGEHLERMREYSRVLALHLGGQPRFEGVINDAFVDCIYGASPLHDIGKVGVPDSILQKPGKLTDAEFAEMKVHTTLGADTLRAVYAKHDNNGFVHMGIEIAECHHEKYDGSGYPLGLAGEQIPLSARIVALADVYDALTSKRCYKEAMPHEKAAAIIREQSGRHFDPVVVEAFFELEDAFRDIAHRWSE